MINVTSIYKSAVASIIMIVIALFLAGTGSGDLHAANRYAVATGNWNSTSTWAATSGGSPGASFPVAGDAVYIERGRTVTVNVAASCASISFTNVISSSSTVSISGTNSLTVSGLITMIRPANGFVHTLAVGAGTLTAGALTMSATTSTRNNILSISTGTATISGTVTTGTTGCQFNFTGAGLLKFGGAFSGGPAALTPSSGTVDYTGVAPVIQAFSGSYYNLKFSGTGTTAGSASGTLTIQGNLTNTGGGVLNFSSRPVVLSGTVATNSIAGFTTTGTVSMTKTAGIATYTGNVSSGAFTLNGTGGTLNLGTGLSHTVSGTFTRTNGTINLSSSVLHVNGATSGTGGTWTSGTGTVEYGMAGAQTVFAVAYYHLKLSGSGIKTMTSVSTVNGNLVLAGTATATTAVNFNIGGNLSIGNGTTFTAAGFALTITGTTTVGEGTSGRLIISSATGAKRFTGLVTLNPGGTWTNTTANCPVEFRGGITNNGIFNAGTGVHTFSTGNQALAGGLSIRNMTVTGITVTNNGNLTCTGSLNGTGGLTNAATGILNIDFTGAVGIATLTASQAGNVVDYGFAGTQTVKPVTYSKLILSSSGLKTFAGVTTINSDMSVNSSVSVNLGTYTSQAYTLTLAGNMQPVGSWGGTGSGATYINSTFFAAASGILNVTATCVTGTWLGTTDTDWHNGTNWCGGVPNSATNVVIPSGGNQPVIGASALCNDFTLQPGASVAITGSNTLTVSGNWVNNGTFTANSSTVIFDGTGPGSIGASNFNNISFSGSGTKTATGSLDITGNLSISNNFTAGTYTHTVGGSWANTGTFIETGSTINFNGGSSTTIGAGNFDHVIISGAGSKSAPGAITIAGNFDLTSGALIFSDPASNTISIGGNYTQTGGLFDFNASTTGTSTMLLGGSLTQTSGAESMTTSGAGAFNGVIIFNGTGIQTMSFATPQGASWVKYIVPSGKSVSLLSDISLNSANDATQADYQGEINISGTFDLGTYVVNQAGGVPGNALFTVNPGANLVTSNVNGITGSVSSINMTTTFSSSANYEFRGAATGTFTTTPSVNTVNDLTINSSTDIALTTPMTVAGTMSLVNGNFGVGSNTLTIMGNSPVRTSGSVEASAAGATIVFANTEAIILPDGFFTGNVNQLTISGAGGITSAGDFTVEGSLNLFGSNTSSATGILDMWDGTGMKTLTMLASATTTGPGEVTGIVRRISFVADTEYSFGNQYTTMTIAGGGTMPAELRMMIMPGSTPAWKSDAIQRVYDIVRTGGANCAVSLKLHYLDTELNTNPEEDLFIWDFMDNTIPIRLEKQPKSASSLTENWISTPVADISYFATAFSEHTWTMAMSLYVTFEGTKGWRMISSPTNTTSEDLLTGFISQGVPGSSYPEKQPNFLWFDETDTLTTNMSWRTSPFNDVIVPGTGYYFYVFDSISGAYSDKLPRQMTSAGNAYFTGTFSYSGLNHPVTYSPRVGGQINQSPADTIFYDTNIDDQGWNLLGNPTSSSLDWDAPLGWTKTHIDNTIYIWDPGINQFRVWNGTTGNLGSGLISPFQAFWVKANQPGPELGFTSDVLTSGGTFYGGTSVKSTPLTKAPAGIGLRLHASGLEGEIIVSFSDDGKAGPDIRDAYRLEPLSRSSLEFFTLSSPAHTMPLVINNQPADGPDCIILPLYAGGRINGHELDGSFTMDWELPTDWPDDWAISLNDHSAQKAISMRKEHSYSFVLQNLKSSDVETVSDTGGFVPPVSLIHPVAAGSKLKSSTEMPPFSIVIRKGTYKDDPLYLAPEPRLLQNFPNPFIQHTTFRFSLPLPANVTLKIYDIQGHLVDGVTDGHFPAGIHDIPWSNIGLKAGIYMLQMITPDIIKTKKLIITTQ